MPTLARFLFERENRFAPPRLLVAQASPLPHQQSPSVMTWTCPAFQGEVLRTSCLAVPVKVAGHGASWKTLVSNVSGWQMVCIAMRRDPPSCHARWEAFSAGWAWWKRPVAQQRFFLASRVECEFLHDEASLSSASLPFYCLTASSYRPCQYACVQSTEKDWACRSQSIRTFRGCGRGHGLRIRPGGIRMMTCWPTDTASG